MPSIHKIRNVDTPRQDGLQCWLYVANAIRASSCVSCCPRCTAEEFCTKCKRRFREPDAWLSEKSREFPLGEMRDEHQIRRLVGDDKILYRVTDEEGSWWCTSVARSQSNPQAVRLTDYKRAQEAWKRGENVHFIINSLRHWTLMVLFRRHDGVINAVCTNSLGEARSPSREALAAIETCFNREGERNIIFV